MIIREIIPEEKEAFDKIVTHPLQSWAWGEFREKTGLEVIRIGQFNNKQILRAFQLTIHKIPKTKFTIGYLPKAMQFDKSILQTLRDIGKQKKCIFIKIEPNLTQGEQFFLSNGCVYGKPLFTKYTFQINLTKSKKELLSQMKSKTRYNVRLAKRKGVKVVEDNSLDAFNQYLELTFETTKRQGFYAHNKDYHRKMWQTLYPSGIAHLLKAIWKNKTLATWILFTFNNTLYYPYGASSSEHRDVMASNKIMWEAILFGKKMGCEIFDLWGSLGSNPDKNDPWYGFHRFKKGYGPRLVEFIGTFDLVLNKNLYKIYNIVDSLRWKLLKIKSIFNG